MIKLYKIFVFSFIPLLIGGLIYIGFRENSLLMFRWFEALNIINLIELYRNYVNNISLPEYVIYTLPNGLWVFAFLMYIHITIISKIRILLLISCIIVSLSFEFLQIFNIIPGTFCWSDFLTIAIFIIAYFLLTKGEKIYETSQI